MIEFGQARLSQNAEIEDFVQNLWAIGSIHTYVNLNLDTK